MHDLRFEHSMTYIGDKIAFRGKNNIRPRRINLIGISPFIWRV